MRGFSLLEIIIAIAILGTGIVGSAALTNLTIRAGFAVKNQLIATNLAQEGMEVIYSIRHTNWIKNAPWDDGVIVGDSCANFNSTSLINPCSGEMGRLFISENRYRHNPIGAQTVFLRHINISSGVDNGTPFKLIRSTVSWGSSSINVEEKLYDWK